MPSFTLIRLSALAVLAPAALAIGVACAQAPATTGIPPTTAPAATTAPGGIAPTAAPAAPTAAPKPKVDQKLTGLLLAVGIDLDPWGIVSAPTNAYMNLAFETLISLDSGQPTPALAESWRVVNPTTWEFKLKDRRYWNNEPVTAADVKFSMEQAKDVRQSAALGPTFVGTIARIDTPDPRTVVLTTSEPDVLIPNKVSRIPVYPSALYTSMGREKFLLEPVGSGPYRPRSLQPRERVTFTPSESWAGQKGNLTEITLRGAPEASTRIAALRTGEGDFASQLDLDQVPQLAPFGAKPYFPNTPAIISFFFDTNSPQFRDKRVRQAFNHAIDRAAIVRGLAQGITEPAPGQPVSKTTFGYNPRVSGYAYDEAQARRLLTEAGWDAGQTIKVGYPATQPFYNIAAETITPYLQRAGVRAELGSYDNAVNLAGFRNNTLGPFILSIITASTYADPSISLSSLTSLPGQGSGRWANPDFDRLYVAQAAEFDRTRRDQTLQQMMQLIHDEAVLLPMYSSWTIWGTADRVGDFEVSLTGNIQWLKVQRLK